MDEPKLTLEQKEQLKSIRLLSTGTGISKRLMMAFSDFRGTIPQIEDSLYQLSSVVDSTSKLHFPNENSSKKRFEDYLDQVETDLWYFATNGKLTLIDSKFNDNNGESKKFSEILYKIRCSSFHDPEEVESMVLFEDGNRLGHTSDNKFIISLNLTIALFLILLTDEKNIGRIDLNLFDDTHFIEFNDTKHLLNELIGKRDLVRESFKNMN